MSKVNETADTIHPLDSWPEADRRAWIAACQPAERLKPGGAAAHLRPVTRDDLARRYGRSRLVEVMVTGCWPTAEAKVRMKTMGKMTMPSEVVR